MWVEVSDEVEFVIEEEFEVSGVPVIVFVAAECSWVNDRKELKIVRTTPDSGGTISEVFGKHLGGKEQLGEARLEGI